MQVMTEQEQADAKFMARPPLLATHRITTPGYPPTYALRERDALQIAEDRWKADQKGSDLEACTPRSPYEWYRSYP